jgi:hypothetical protein
MRFQFVGSEIFEQTLRSERLENDRNDTKSIALEKHKVKRFKTQYLILLLPAGALLGYIFSFFPGLVERFYSRGFNRFVVSVLSSATGVIPFSLAELIIVLLLFILIWRFIQGLAALIKGKVIESGSVLKFTLNTVAGIACIYFAFILLWGLNYYRVDFSDIAKLEVRPASVQELASVCEDLIERANMLREKVSEDNNGVMKIDSKAYVFSRAFAGFKKAAEIYPELGGRYGKPKGVILSNVMSYLGISGVYFPFTGEANVNTFIPDVQLPSSACHEMAHQRGFAKEDEANYIAYLTCSLNPSPDFKYSGVILALIHSTNMLKEYDSQRYEQLRANYSDGVRRDIDDISAFWDQYKGPAERISNDINDLYLKSNRQKDGVYSYNRMVDLLIAEYRSNKILWPSRNGLPEAPGQGWPKPPFRAWP